MPTTDSRASSGLHVGLVLSSLGGGGAERVLLTLAAALIERGHRVDLLLLRPEVRFRQVHEQLRLYYLQGRKPTSGIRAGQIGRPSPLAVRPWSILAKWRDIRRRYPELALGVRNARDVLGVARYVHEAKPMLLMSALQRADLATMLAAPALSVPVAVSIHTNIECGYTPLQLRRALVLLPLAAAVVGVSKGVTRQVRERLQLPQDRVRTIYNGFAVDRIRSLSQQAVSHPWFNDADTPIVLAVGRSALSKDHPTLVAAFCRVRRRRGARLVFIGEFPAAERRHLLTTAEPFARSDIAFIDFDENPYRYMRLASVFVNSSRWEGLSSALLEAMASGTPVVATDAPFGTAEILANGRWGALVPVGDAVRLAQAIEATLDGERPSTRDLQRRAADFDASTCAIEYEKLFAEVVAAA